ncbi:MAG: hypothetical protein J6P48_03990, partial [Oscillospiraceae bacterium]|nr:hypothetical protein [Oscillospiraceae bacterium]
EVEGLNGRNAGELLTGVSREVFRRSAFIEQGGISVTGGPEVEKRISSIVSTGEETTSFSEADEKLRSWMRKRRYNRNGELPEIEARLDEANRELETAREGAEKLAELETQLENSAAECSRLETELTEARKKQRKSAMDRLGRADQELEARRKTLEECSALLAGQKQQLRTSRIGTLDRREAEARTAADIERYQQLEAEAEGKKTVSPLLFILLLVFAAVCAAVYMVKESVWLMVAAACFLLPGIGFAMAALKARNSLRDARDEQAQILRNYAAEDLGEIQTLEEEQRRLFDTLQETEKKVRAAGEAYNRAREAQMQMRQNVVTALDFSAEGVGEAAALTAQLETARQQKTQIENELSRLRGRLENLGDSVAVESDIRYLEERYDIVNREYEALDLAERILREADGEIQSRFSPQLGKLAAEYMSVLTGGRYDEVLIARDFSAMTRRSGDSVARDSGYLSTGTLDLLYLAVRLAVCELALPEGENCPLILDDALVNLDEERTGKALQLLAEIARSRQVILFTCREIG